MTFIDVLSRQKSESGSTSSGTNTQSTVSGDAKTDNSEQNINIWSHILQEVQNSTKKTPPPKSIILLGDNESGRSTLVSRLKGVENISKGIGLEYHYVDIKDEDRDDTPKLSVWIPDGDGTCTSLLKFALNEPNFENTLIVFVVSMSTPWSIMDSLKKWSTILKDHIKKLNIPDSKYNEYLRQQCRSFQLYQDPDENQQILLNTGKKNSNAVQTPSKQQQAQIDLDNKLDTNDDLLLPLDPSILSKNLGLSIIVVLTKSDSISILDKENEYRIEHFDFIQYHIRRFCLDYGAALFYTTIKDKRTYDRLYKYLIHKLYNYPFNIPASVVDRESIFIPSGWDNEGKINILLENSTTIKSDSEYSDIISKPSIRKPLQRDVETVFSMEDQDFLSKLQILLNKTASPSIKQDDLNSSQTINNSTSTPQAIKTPHKPAAQVLKGANPNAPDSTNLKNFFQNLLNKNAPSNTSTSTSTTLTSSASSSNLASANDQQTPNTPPVQSSNQATPQNNNSSESNA